jgi:ElaB/YqjD/DUF883 family membrane-anchored ribosome-binding protein
MFQYRSDTFGPSVTSIQRHLGAVERELEKIGRTAGRRGSAAMAATGEQIGDTISGILSDMIDRFRESGQAASDQAARLGGQAARLGASYGSNALRRMAREAEDRPLVTLGVALGIGILIGAAVLGSVNSRR